METKMQHTFTKPNQDKRPIHLEGSGYAVFASNEGWDG